MLRKFLVLHVIPFAIACVLIFFLLLGFEHYSKTAFDTVPLIIKGDQNKTSGVYANLVEGNNTELDYIASIKNEKQLTIFGSSEFSSSPFCSYHFLPDSMGIQALGIGHAYHQNFSILCELLAAKEFLKNSKICIILSVSWFHTTGTNTEAFVEFVRPNFLNKIALDETIELKYKVAIGKYIEQNYADLTGISNSMALLQDEYLLSNSYGFNQIKMQLRKKLKQIHKSTYSIQDVKYVPVMKYVDYKKGTFENPELIDELQRMFIESITTNSIYVYDDYYKTYLLDEEGNQRSDSIAEPNFENNQELNDFKLVVDLLASNKANCSFIIQPMNPYYYQYTDRNQPLVDTLTHILNQHKIPYLNLFVSKKEDYAPGTLKDIMHLGDYGWMKINYFLDSLYHEN